MDPENHVKVAFLGDVNCGKSSIISQFIMNSFEVNSMPTIGACNFKKTVTLDNKCITFNVWDTAGQEKYRSISKMLYRDAKAVVLVFDMCSKASFLSLETWHQSVIETAPSNVIEIIVGNKSDKGVEFFEVKEKEAEDFAKKNNAKFYLVSAKSGDSIDLVFYEIATRIDCKVIGAQQNSDDASNSSFFLSQNRIKRKKRSCC